MMKKLIIATLFLLSVASLTSCASDSSVNSETTAAETTASTSAEPRLKPNVPDSDFEGYNFRVLTKGTTSAHWSSFDIAAEEQNGEPINDAVYQRNTNVGEKYNFTVEDVPVQDYDNMPAEATQAVLAGDNAYDMFALHVSSLINNGYLYNLNDMEYLDLSQPWYDSNIIEEFTLADKLYVVTGDMLIMDNQATIGVTFNKKIADDFDFASEYGSDFYGLVNDGKWTLDVFHETAAAAATDLNGDGAMTDLEDLWGFQTEFDNYILMFFGSGEKQIRLENDYPVPALGSDRTVSVVEKICSIHDDKCTLNATEISGNYSDVWSECMDKNFIEGRVLYSVAGLNRVTLFRSMDVDFGILPLPKFEEVQDSYYSPVDPYCSNYISFPATMVEAERNAIIVEALSCESMYTLTPAYYDVTLTGKAVRDEESLDMLDIIFGNRVWDLGFYFGWGSINSIFSDSSTFASELASSESSIISEIDKTMEIIMGE